MPGTGEGVGVMGHGVIVGNHGREALNNTPHRVATPFSIPEMNLFCRNRYSTTIGSATSTPAADSSE
jgi:hypothetical protein